MVTARETLVAASATAANRTKPIPAPTERRLARASARVVRPDDPHRSIRPVSRNDVLCTADGAFNEHPGNCRYRALVSERWKRYAASSGAEGESRAAVEVVRTVTEGWGGLFLRRAVAESDESWVDVGSGNAAKMILNMLTGGATKGGATKRKNEGLDGADGGKKPRSEIGKDGAKGQGGASGEERVATTEAVGATLPIALRCIVPDILVCRFLKSIDITTCSQLRSADANSLAHQLYSWGCTLKHPPKFLTSVGACRWEVNEWKKGTKCRESEAIRTFEGGNSSGAGEMIVSTASEARLGGPEGIKGGDGRLKEQNSLKEKSAADEQSAALSALGPLLSDSVPLGQIVPKDVCKFLKSIDVRTSLDLKSADPHDLAHELHSWGLTLKTPPDFTNSLENCLSKVQSWKYATDKHRHTKAATDPFHLSSVISGKAYSFLSSIGITTCAKLELVKRDSLAQQLHLWGSSLESGPRFTKTIESCGNTVDCWRDIIKKLRRTAVTQPASSKTQTRNALSGKWILDKGRGSPSMRGYLETMGIQTAIIKAHKKLEDESDTIDEIILTETSYEIKSLPNEVKTALVLGQEKVIRLRGDRTKMVLATSNGLGHVRLESSMMTQNGMAHVTDERTLDWDEMEGTPLMIQNLTIDVTGKTHTTVRFFIPYTYMPTKGGGM